MVVKMKNQKNSIISAVLFCLSSWAVGSGYTPTSVSTPRNQFPPDPHQRFVYTPCSLDGSIGHNSSNGSLPMLCQSQRDQKQLRVGDDQYRMVDNFYQGQLVLCEQTIQRLQAEHESELDKVRQSKPHSHNPYGINTDHLERILELEAENENLQQELACFVNNRFFLFPDREKELQQQIEMLKQKNGSLQRQLYQQKRKCGDVEHQLDQQADQIISSQKLAQKETHRIIKKLHGQITDQQKVIGRQNADRLTMEFSNLELQQRADLIAIEEQRAEQRAALIESFFTIQRRLQQEKCDRLKVERDQKDGLIQTVMNYHWAIFQQYRQNWSKK